MKMPTVNSDTYLTTAQAAKKLKISQESVRKYCANFEAGRTPAIRGHLMGRSWFISPTDLKQFIDARKTVGRPRQAG